MYVQLFFFESRLKNVYLNIMDLILNFQTLGVKITNFINFQQKNNWNLYYIYSLPITKIPTRSCLSSETTPNIDYCSTFTAQKIYIIVKSQNLKNYLKCFKRFRIPCTTVKCSVCAYNFGIIVITLDMWRHNVI